MHISLYVHFPFCVKKCLYCDFNSRGGIDFSSTEYADLLITEMELASRPLPTGISAPTLYFGGGTPSLMAPSDVGRVVEAADRLFHLEHAAEITLEANPGTLDATRAREFRQAGINRLSLGVQALEDRLLARLGRIHTVKEALAAIDAARAGGFDNLGIDLMHSLPEQTLPQWEASLKQALALAPEHLSAYALSVEQGTPFAALEQRGELPLPDEEEGARMFEATSRVLSEGGLCHYEISNFARPGLESRHNNVYWTRGSYLGFGAGAHSFFNPDGIGKRWENDADVGEYAASLREGRLPARERQLLTLGDAISESFFLGLRLLDGVDLTLLRDRYGEEPLIPFLNTAEQLVAQGLLERDGTLLRLAPHAVIVANTVFSRFL